MKKILLMGNPNVGKSVVFSRLTGVGVISSNYPGTTVEFVRGNMMLDDQKVDVVDVPGTYTLEPTNLAEKVALEMLNEAIGDKDIAVVNIVDATNLERNLNVTLQLLKKDILLIVVLNLWDEAKHTGITIDAKKLEEILGVPVMPTVAVTGEGIKELIGRLNEAKKSAYEYEDAERWHEIGKIIERVQTVRHRHHTFWERLGDLTIKPMTGILIAFIILFGTFTIIRFIGEGLINHLLDPLFNNYYFPWVARIVGLIPVPFIRALFLGTTPNVLESFGLLTTGLYIPLVVVLPYLFGFYLVLSFLEDWGYLPRLAVLLDSIFHRVGLHGYSAIPIILGLGCKVPAMLATRVLETRREKVIATALIMMSAPCMPQTAMIVSLVMPHGARYLALIFGVLIAIAVLTSFLLNGILKGETPELFIEIPPYRVPRLSILLRKVWLRLGAFFIEAIPLIMLGVFFIGILEQLKVINAVSVFFGAPLEHILGLPPQTALVMISGFLRKDVSIALLEPFNLGPEQLVVACIFLVLYLPCCATFFVMAKEMGWRDALRLLVILLGAGFLVGGTLNLILKII
jgi:ferrous iron transport protein B